MLITNWYSIFYWISVADGVKGFFDIASNIFSWGACILLILVIILTIVITGYSESENSAKAEVDRARKFLQKFALSSFILAVTTWTVYVFCPSKKDALIIVAGGMVGNFIDKDTSVRQIPTEAIELLRSKIREEMNEIDSPEPIPTDQLIQKSKEELIEIIKQKTK